MSAPDEISVPVRPSPGQPVYDRGVAGRAAFERFGGRGWWRHAS